MDITEKGSLDTNPKVAAMPAGRLEQNCPGARPAYFTPSLPATNSRITAPTTEPMKPAPWPAW